MSNSTPVLAPKSSVCLTEDLSIFQLPMPVGAACTWPVEQIPEELECFLEAATAPQLVTVVSNEVRFLCEPASYQVVSEIVGGIVYVS